MSHPLAEARLKVQHALSLVEVLNQITKSDSPSGFVTIAARVNAETQRPEYYIAEVRDVPRFALVVGDIVHNLRSALDHIAYRVALLHDPCLTESQLRRVQFPVGDDSEHFERIKRMGIVGFAPTSIALLDEVRPFKGGNDALWRLHRLDITDKHRALLTVVMTMNSFDFAQTPRLPPEMGVPEELLSKLSAKFTLKEPVPAKAGEVLFIDAPNAGLKNGLGFEFEVMLSEPQVCGAQRIKEALFEMGRAVEAAIAIFDSLFASCFGRNSHG
jgi:hypothetical protein